MLEISNAQVMLVVDKQELHCIATSYDSSGPVLKLIMTMKYP